MVAKLLEYLERSKLRSGIALVLTFAVVFTTTYSLVLPAITMDQEDGGQHAGHLGEQRGDDFGLGVQSAFSGRFRFARFLVGFVGFRFGFLRRLLRVL